MMGSTKTETLTQNSSLNRNATALKPYGKVILTLKNELLPEEKLSPTPSQNDGLDIETETDLRIYGCELIQTAGILLKLPQVAMATGQVLLQRFYYSKSLVRHPVEHTAMACVCLASKIEETPRRVRDVINVFTHIRQVNSNKTIQPVILDVNYISLKNLVIKAERRVLKELGFCVHIKHPHKIIVMYLQVLGYEKNQKLMQHSWNYMNDSLRTDVFVRYQPETVACACIYLTARKLQLPLPKNPSWYSIFGASEVEIRDIARRILKLYTRPKANIELLEKKVDELSKQYHDARVKARGGGANPTNSGNNTPTTQTNDSNSPNNNNNNNGNKTSSAGAHNAWGGFISRSGSHIAPPPLNSSSNSENKRLSRSRSPSHSPPPATSNNVSSSNVGGTSGNGSSKHNSMKRSKKRSRSPGRNHSSSSKKNHKRRSYTRSRSNSPVKSRKSGREKRRSSSPSDKYIDRYEKNDRYEKDRYHDDGKKDVGRHDKDKKYDRDDKYSKKSSSKHEKDGRERSKDRRR